MMFRSRLVWFRDVEGVAGVGWALVVVNGAERRGFSEFWVLR